MSKTKDYLLDLQHQRNEELDQKYQELVAKKLLGYRLEETVVPSKKFVLDIVKNH